jgi:tetratricopeptide (TPR) repeat protein
MSARGSRGLSLVAALALVACAGKPPTLGSVRALLAKGKLDDACAGAQRLVEAGGKPAAQLDAQRVLVACMARAGRLATLRKELAQRRAPALLYARALARLAASPAELPAALRLLDEAERAWPTVGEIPFRAGLILLADARPAAAEPYLRRACKRASTARCSATLAHALLDLDRPEAARREVGKLLTRDPRPRDIARGRLLIRRLRRRQQRMPPTARKLFVRARQRLIKKDNAAGALAALRELAIDHPRLAAAHTLGGLAHLRLGNLARAVASFQQAARIDPKDARNHYYLGVIYRARRQPQAAILHYRRALALDPFLWRATAQLGRLLAARRRHKEAATLLDRLVLLAPSHVSRRMAGRAHLRAGTLQQAEGHFRRLLEREPRDFEAHLRLAQILLRLHREGPPERRGAALEQAREHATEAAAIRPSDPEVKQLLGRLKAR